MDHMPSCLCLAASRPPKLDPNRRKFRNRHYGDSIIRVRDSSQAGAAVSNRVLMQTITHIRRSRVTAEEDRTLASLTIVLLAFAMVLNRLKPCKW
jgi:hypothetical protein